MTRAKHTKNQFKILIERDADGYFVASVPSLPGCHTQAKTYAQLMNRVRDAIKLCLDVAKADPAYRQTVARYGDSPSFVGVEVISF